MSDLGRVVRSYLASRKRFAEGGDVTADDLIEQARERLASQPQRMRGILPDVGDPLIGDGGQLSPGTAWGNRAADIGSRYVSGTARGLVDLPRQAIENSQRSLDTGDYDPSTPVAAALLTLGTGAGARGGLRQASPAGYNPTHEPAAAAPAEAVLDVGRGVEGTPGGGASLREAQLQAQRRAGARQPLPGLPQGKQVVEGQPFFPGPVALAHDVADAYMAGKNFGHPHPEKFHDLDVEHARAIAKAFDEMPHAPNDPKVKAAYEALIEETLAQYQAIKASGLKITPVGGADYPYHGNPRAVAKDVADNNHMAFFKTSDGFGVGEKPDPNHPMLRSSGEKIGDYDMLNNDIFRVVHDYFGHIKNGYGFRAAGEDNAWRSHAAMYSPLARPAMTSETRGQNSWVNYGPHGDFNRTANGADTIYSDQKVGLMPEWTMYDHNQPGVWWHGSASGDLRGGDSGLHLGTHKAATTALQARIGIPAHGRGWNGNEEYGKTLLAGSDTLKKMGPYLESGFNAGSSKFQFPKEDFYAGDYFKENPDAVLKYPDGTPMPLDVKPSVQPYRLTGDMTNTPSKPHPDYHANGYMRGQLKRGTAKRGYFYKNQGEDTGSVSVVVPNGDHVERRAPGGRIGYADGGEVDAEGMAPENYEQMKAVGRGVLNVLRSIADVPRRAFQSSETMRKTGDYDPGPVLDAAMLPMGTGAIAGVPVKGAEAVLGAGVIRKGKGATGVHLPVPEPPGLMPQLAERYPEIAPPVPQVDKVTGKSYLGKDLSDEALELQKHRLAMKPEIEAGSYEPYFDQAKRANVDPSKYPPMTDTKTLLMKKEETRARYDRMASDPEAIQRLETAYARGLAQKDVAGNWYFMKQLENEFIKEYGAKQGRALFKERFADAMAATTGKADPTTNLLSAHYGNFLKEKGLPVPEAGHQFPFPVGGMAAKSNMDQYSKMIMEGRGITDANPKRYNFSGNFLGHADRATIDEQMSRLFQPGLEKPATGAYGHYEQVLADLAAHHGVDPRYFQEVAWAGAKDAASKGGYKAKPMISHVNDAIERTRRVTGMSPSEIVRRALVRGEIPLYGAAGAAALPALQNKGDDGFAEGGAAGDDYNTVVNEPAFQAWKAANAPLDTGVDYDLRGAYQANVQRAQDGHMTDRFKKPNHPTFSDQSQYATGDQRARAGYWVGDTFVPPSYAEGGMTDDEPAAPTFDPAKFAAFKAATPAPAATPPSFDPAKFAAYKSSTQKPMDAGEVLSEAAMNTPASAWQFAKDVVRPFVHPIETATSIKDLGLGVAEKAANRLRHEWGGQPVPGEHEKYADAMGSYLADRYGGVENVKRAFAKDPVGVLSDASMILTGGGSAGARLPGILGKTGEIVGKVGRAVDPLMAPVNAAKVGTKITGELLTHTGATPLETAYRTGVEGGEAADVFRDQMRGSGDMVAPVAMAKQGLEGYRAARAKSYREGMGDITSIDRQMDPLDRVLDFGKIDDAVDKARKVQTFRTRVLDKGANEVRNAMITEINEWKALPPADYHTIEGLDALKRSLGHMMMDTAPGTSSRKAAGDIYNAVRQTIVDYDPKYAKVMKDYEMASAQVRELERAMSLGEKASADTALRKLQSIMRNNVNANYGRRLELGQLLQEHGATHLMSALAGQSASAWFPRGLGKFVASADLAGAVGAAGVHGFNPLPLVGAAVTLPLMSPRLMGETAHFAGRTAGRALERTNKGFGKVGLGNRTVGNASYRLGRATNPYENADPANPYAQ